MEPLLEVRNVHKSFSGKNRERLKAVDDVSFCLYPGEILGIVGESGSGKSTLARMLTRLAEPDSGTIILEGQDITRSKGRELRELYRKIQMVFQSPAASFDPRLSLGEGIGEGLRNMGCSKSQVKARVLCLLESCGLSEEFSGRYPHQVSGGECQRAAIARALAVSPKLLICDEACSALDVTVQKQIIHLLQKLWEETGLSIIFISHDIALVQQFCTRMLVMQEGRIVEQGEPDALIMFPQSEYTKKLIEAVL